MTNEVIVYPDARTIAIGYLRAALVTRGETDVKVQTRVPAPNDHDLIRIFRTGGIASVVFDQAQLTVETYADTDVRAHDLAQLARAILISARDDTHSGVMVYAVTEFSGPQESPDPVSEKPRYSQSIQFSVRGAAA